MEAPKISLPGWRIEQRFSPGVLIGNWSEERHRFLKGDYPPHNSTHRTDFRHWASNQPDVIIRRKAQLRDRGLPSAMIFHHHGKRHLCNLVSSYDEYYNGRWSEMKLPTLRKWDCHQLAWLPEKINHAIRDPPTNWGLFGRLQKEWVTQLAEQTSCRYLSTYNINYQDRQLQHRARPIIHATPAKDSSALLPEIGTLKNQDLRNCRFLKVTEHPTERKDHSCYQQTI